MGCLTSKHEDSPAVLLCRERCKFLEETLSYRSIFAEAHLSYVQSLIHVGVSLNRFFVQDLEVSGHAPSSPVFHTKSTSPPRKSQQISDSGSHINFHTDDSEDEEDSGSESFHRIDGGSPLHSGYGYGMGYENMNMNRPHPGAGGGSFMNVNYMRNQARPSIVYTQRPLNPENMQTYVPYSSSSYNPYPNPYSDYASYGNHQRAAGPSYSGYNYNSNYGGYPEHNTYGGQGMYFSSSSQPPPYDISVPDHSAVPSTSKAPPPPPEPRSSSTWDFLNLFSSSDNYYPPYTPSRDSREVREAENIPDLEEDDEVVKEVYGHQKFVDVEQNGYSKSDVADKKVRAVNEVAYEVRPPLGLENDPVEYDVHLVDKKVVGDEGNSKDRAKASNVKQRDGFMGDLEVLKKIENQFGRAADSGRELSKLLETETYLPRRKNGLNRVSSKLLSLSMVSSLTTSKIPLDSDSTMSEIDQEVQVRAKKLSSILDKLYQWEKKLYQEVKIEENLRLLHEMKSKRLKRLDDNGAEASKIHATRESLRTLSNQIQMAIQVVDKISVKINSLRDEDLWPRLNEFLQGFAAMWKAMRECHRYQCRAIVEAKHLDAAAVQKYFTNDHLESTRQLEHDLINWTLRFSDWISAQKKYVQAMSNWLMKCLLYVPEETADGTVPFSPGRIGAPPIFVVCYHWWLSMERISEKEVVASMRDLTSTVLRLGERDRAAMRQKMLVNRDERKVKSLDREDQKIKKDMVNIEKRVVLISTEEKDMTGHVYQSETSKSGSLQASLQHVLEEMERYADKSLKMYEELQQQIQEEHLDHGKEQV